MKNNLYENIPSIILFGGSDDDLFGKWKIPFDNPKPFKFVAEIIKNFTREITQKRLIEASKYYAENHSKPMHFKKLKLMPSHYKSWQNYQGSDVKQLEMQFGEFVSTLVANWKEENLLTEIILMEGFPLDSSIEEVKNIKTNKIKQVTSGFHEHRLLVCLDKKIAYATIQSLKLSSEDVFICMDSTITDHDKVQLADKGMIKTI